MPQISWKKKNICILGLDFVWGHDSGLLLLFYNIHKLKK